ncbi:hypothetical protein LZ32DRAFT_257391 [Colletotrichum eremochloae]|nr:hypothetical protein LZ32DRAFT_257391 [Colletotrichum eremochloae]
MTVVTVVNQVRSDHSSLALAWLRFINQQSREYAGFLPLPSNRIFAFLLPCVAIASSSYLVSDPGSGLAGTRPTGNPFPCSIPRRPCRSDASWHLLHHYFVGSPGRGSSGFQHPCLHSRRHPPCLIHPLPYRKRAASAQAPACPGKTAALMPCMNTPSPEDRHRHDARFVRHSQLSRDTLLSCE